MFQIRLFFAVVIAGLLIAVALQHIDRAKHPIFRGRITRLIDGTEYGNVSGAAPGSARYFVLIRPTDGSQDSTGAPWCVGLDDSAAFCALVENQLVQCRVDRADSRWAVFAP